MEFCPKCSSYVKKNVIENKIRMICHCGFELDVKPSDTLMSSGALSQNSDITKYADYIKNSSSDLGSTKVKRTCKKCKLDYMVMINITDDNLIVYTCSCGEVEM